MGWAVVVKLLGRTIGIRQLRTQLQTIWRPTGGYQVTDLDDDCFLVKFREDVDFQNALIGGPWQIYGHYLTVQPWTPEFRPQHHVINQVVGWIRLPRLPARYYHKTVIRSIGSVFGEVIRVDYNTDSGDRGKFARLAVLLDLTKPLISKIQVDGELIYVEYEGLPTICFACGHYGHLQESCPETMAKTGDVQVNTMLNPTARESSLQTESRATSQFGAWMQVQRRRRPYDRGTSGQRPTTVATASRFSVLTDMAGFEEEPAKVYDTVRSGQRGDTVLPKRKGKEQRGPKKPDLIQRSPPPLTRTTSSDTLFGTRAYAALQNTISLDAQHHSAVSIVDNRLHPTSTAAHHALSQVEPEPPAFAPSTDCHADIIKPPDPLSRSRGVKLASGLTIHNLGVKPNIHSTGPSVKAMKELARAAHSETDDRAFNMFQKGVDPNASSPI